MIIQLSSTLIILGLIRRRIQKQIAHIPLPVATDHSDLIIVIREHVEPRRSRGRRPAQPLSIGREVVDLDGPWELHERVGPRDEFLRGEYDHGVSFLMNSVMSCLSLGSSVVDIRMP